MSGPGAVQRLNPRRLQGRAWFVCGALAAAALATEVLLATSDASPLSEPEIPWWLLVVLFAGAEAIGVRLRLFGESISVGLVELPLVLGLFLASPDVVVGCAVAGGTLGLLMRRRVDPLGLLFNVARFALTATVAVVVFRLLHDGGSDVSLAHQRAAFAAMAAAEATAFVLIVFQRRLAGERWHSRRLAGELAFGLLATFAATAVALLPVALIDAARASALWLIAVPALSLVVANRASARERHREDRIDMLRAAMTAIADARDERTAVRQLLDALQDMFDADTSQLVLFGDAPGVPAVRYERSDGVSTAKPLGGLSPGLERLVAACEERSGLLLDMRSAEPAIKRDVLEPLGLRRALAVVLRGADRPLGLVLVGRDGGLRSRFQADDLLLVEAIARHANISLTALRLNELKDRLRHEALHDALTHLPNRRLFREEVDAALADDAPSSVAILFLDIDDFKAINDTLGHAAGDEAILEASERLQRWRRPTDLVARVGGDEFAVLVRGLSAVDELDEIASRLIRAFSAPFVVHGRQFTLGLSMGGALHRSGAAATDLVREADLAMYECKRAGGGRLRVYDAHTRDAAVTLRELKLDLRAAMEHDEIEVWYQPIHDLKAGGLVAIEALARWRHPERGIVGPDVFVPLAEEAGLMPELGALVLDRAVSELATWRASVPGMRDLAMSVNVSAQQLREPSLVRTVARALDSRAVPAHLLWLEITESATMNDQSVALERLAELRRVGVRLALDDFGTGYSSLSHLHRFPFDLLKVAKEFIDDLGGRQADEAFIHTILLLAERLELTVVAEGIEHDAQVEALQAMGCTLGQGYLLGRPADAEATLAYLLGINGEKIAA